MKSLTNPETQSDEFVDLLIKTGLSKNVAKTFAFIAKRNETCSVDIEKSTGLRQPEVSIAMQELRKMGWVMKRDLKKEGKGRPVHSYKLAMPLEKIVERIEENQRKKIEDISNNIQKLKQHAK